MAHLCACAHCIVLTNETFCETCWINCYDRGFADGRAVERAAQDKSIHDEEVHHVRTGGWLARRQDPEGLPVFDTNQSHFAYEGRERR